MGTRGQNCNPRILALRKPDPRETRTQVDPEMKRNEAKNHAKGIVEMMLTGRCSPEPDDVQGIEGEQEKDMVVQEIEKILKRLIKSLG